MTKKINIAKYLRFTQVLIFSRNAPTFGASAGDGLPALMMADRKEYILGGNNMRNYTEEIRAQHDGKIYREVITFSDLDKNGNKIIVELLRGRRGKTEYIAVDVTRLDGEGVYTGAMDLNPQVERQERSINGVKCVNYVVVPSWLLAPTAENKKKILDEIARRAFS